MTVAVVLFTYASSPESPRAMYAEKTLRTALDNLRTSEDLRVHIADDGSPDGHREFLYRLAGGYPHVHGVTVTNAERRGYGASYNLASQIIHDLADVILPLEDDWALVDLLYLDPHLAVLRSHPRIECIRLGYLGHTDLLSGRVESTPYGDYLLFDPQSPEHHVFAGHPRLETVTFQRQVGPWLEGLDAGSTEREVAAREASRYGVAWPLGRGPFAHIGTVQARTDQVRPDREVAV